MTHALAAAAAHAIDFFENTRRKNDAKLTEKDRGVAAASFRLRRRVPGAAAHAADGGAVAADTALEARGASVAGVMVRREERPRPGGHAARQGAVVRVAEVRRVRLRVGQPGGGRRRR